MPRLAVCYRHGIMYVITCILSVRRTTKTVSCAVILNVTPVPTGEPTPITPALTHEPKSLGWTVFTGYASSHLFRGVSYGDNLWEVGASMPFKLSAARTFTPAPWYAELGNGDFNELDLVGSFTWDTGAGRLTFGCLWFGVGQRSQLAGGVVLNASF